MAINFEVINSQPDKFYKLEVTAEANYLAQTFFNPQSGMTTQKNYGTLILEQQTLEKYCIKPAA